jgi:hypothetical protein
MNTELTSEQYDRVMRVLYENQPVETLQSPEELHQFAWNYNRDDGLEALRRVINHPFATGQPPYLFTAFWSRVFVRVPYCG